MLRVRSISKFGARTIVASACLLSGCGPDAGAETEAADVLQALDRNWMSGPHVWNQGQQAVVMQPEATHVCILTKAKGHFVGYGEKLEVVVGLDPQGSGRPMWLLRGQSQQSGVGGEAYCFAKSGFLANGSERWNSPQWVTRTNGSCGTSSVNAWPGHAATFVSGLSGKFEGGGEKVSVTQSLDFSTPAKVIAQGCQGALETKAHSFYAGGPSASQLARYWGGSGAGGLFSLPIHSTCSPYSSEIPLAPADNTMCHFVSIAGDFGGGAEIVQIYPKPHPVWTNDWWYLKVAAGGRCRTTIYQEDGRYMAAQARCYLRDQR